MFVITRSLFTRSIAAVALALSLLAPGLRAGNAPVLAAVKLPPVKTLSDKLMGVARAVYPGQETEMMAMMFLGMFGYPSYPGVSATDGLTIFFFEGAAEQDMPFVLMGKIEASSPLRVAFTRQPDPNNPMDAMIAPGWEVEDRDGWALFSSDTANFKLVSDVAALAKLSADITDFDITTRVYIGPETMDKWARELKEGLTERHIEAGGTPDDERLAFKQRYVDFLASIGENLKWADFGLNVDAQAIALGGAVQALSDTPEFLLFSSSAGGKVPVADFVNTSAAMILAGNMDMGAISTYLDTLETRALEHATAQGQALVKQAAEANREYLAMLAGDWAGNMNFAGTDVTTAYLAGGNMDSATLTRISQAYYEELIPALMEHLAEMGMAEDGAAEFEFKSGVSKIAGNAVDEVISHVATYEFHQGDQEPTKSVQTEETYFTVSGGDVVVASDLDALKALAEVVVTGKPVANNVASRLALASGEVYQFALDLKPFISSFTGEMEPETQAAKAALKQLASADLAPISGNLTIGDGKAKGLNSIPVSTLAAIADTVRRVQQAEKEAQNHGGSMGPMGQ